MKLREIIESYEGLEDADEFGDPAEALHAAAYDLLPERIQYWGKVDDIISNLVLHGGNDPESIADYVIDTYLEYGYELADTPSGYPDDISESYEGLEDSDEFRDSYEESCAFCGRMYDVNPQDEYYCRNCGRTTCPDCEMTADRLPDGEWDMGVYCSPQCRRDHRTFEEATQGPIIRRIQWSPAAIYIQFPSGDLWEYVVYENRWLQDILRRHRRNVGRVVAELKKLNAEARKVS